MNILTNLKISKVVGLGVGAGANVLCRLAIHSPDRVLGLVAIQPTASAASVIEQLKVSNEYSKMDLIFKSIFQQRIIALKLGSIDHGPDSDQYLVYHKFGNMVEMAEDKLEAVEMYKKMLHSDINPRFAYALSIHLTLM